MRHASGSVLIGVIRVVHSVTGATLAPIEVRPVEPAWFAWSISYRRGHALLTVDESLLDEQPDEALLDVLLHDVHMRTLTRPIGRAEQDPLEPPVEDGEGCSALRECGGVHDIGRHEDVEASRDPLVGRITVRRPMPAASTPVSVHDYIVEVAPAPSTVEISLVDQAGHALRGAKVELRGQSGAPAIPLVEASWRCSHSDQAAQGVYRSCPPRVWDARYFPFHVCVQDPTESHPDADPFVAIAERFVDYTTVVTRHRIVTHENFRKRV